MMSGPVDMRSLAGGDVQVQIPPDGGSVHLKAVSPYGDPVELSATEAREVAHALLQLADALGDESSGH
jgi:hypothetical protein